RGQARQGREARRQTAAVPIGIERAVDLVSKAAAAGSREGRPNHNSSRKLMLKPFRKKSVRHRQNLPVVARVVKETNPSTVVANARKWPKSGRQNNPIRITSFRLPNLFR